MKILNLGCGTKVSSSPDIINIDWSIYLRIKKNRVLQIISPLFVKGERLKRFNSLPDNVMVHNLATGLPFATNSVDVVYHSHLLEHFCRNTAKTFLLEVKRVLRPGGVQRIVVPDLEKAAKAYLSHILVCEKNSDEMNKHDSFVATIIEQSIRKEAHGTSQQKPLRAFIENTILGDARRRGETHQWMYDKINLNAVLIGLGYKNPRIQSYCQSLIPNWNQYRLDLDDHGTEYKPDSLYFEVEK